MAQISYGSITIVDTNDIQRFYVQYAKNDSSAAAPTTGWSQDRPTWQNGTYIWQRTVAKREGVPLAPTDYGNPVCITGEKGDTGQQGNTGNGISSIVTVYCNYGSGTPAEGYSGWSSNVPEYDSTKPNYWVKTTVNYTSGDPSITIYKDLGITEAAEKANLAATTAQSAEAHSIEAISIADSKNKIYYSSEIPTTGNYINGDTLFKESSAGTVMYVYDDTYTDPATGHWKQQQFEENAISDLAITNAKIKDLHGDKITANTIAGNKIVAHNITSLQLATDAIKSSNYQAGTAPFSNRGTFLDLSNGNMYSPVFGVNATENNQGAFIKGSVQAYDGKIGQNQLNYWYIGNYYDYNQLTSAYIKGNGTATIQLGNTSTWRLNTNRIHTAWNENKQGGDDYKLHYPVYNSKYWDMGLHVPTSKTDKFIYIRNSSFSTSLTNLQNNINDQANGTNNYWNYQFYITSEGILSAKSLKTINNTFEVTDGGSLYARNIYIKDENGALTQIGGTDAAYLSKTGGTITGDLTVGNATPGDDQQYNGNLRVIGDFLNRSGNNITLQTNLASTAATALTGNSTSPILIGITGTLPSTSGGTGNTSYNAGGVVYADGSSPKKLLSTAAGTSGYLLKSGGSGAPTWVDPGTLTVAAATKATQDGDGNVIKTTYLKLTGGNITGPVSFGDSVTIDDLNTGALVVTGNASFTNNIQANTINNVEVGSNPKFTDTITTITTEGSGNAITAIEATNGALKAIKGSNFLMGITNQQVINAIGYTPYNATNPNNYTANTGTVESVQIQASGPLQSSVSTAQSSSLNTTISFKNQNANTILAGPSSGSAATPTFRTLIAEDIPSLTKSKISDFPTTWALSSITGADDLKAIEALTGTSGLLKKTAANTWTLDTSAYVTSSGVTSITLTQGTGISIGSSGTAITSTGTRTIALANNYGDTKNPYASKTARHVLAAPAAANGVPSFRALTKEDVGLSNVLNIKQVTGIGQGDNGKIRVFKGSGTNDYEDIAVEIVATSTSSVASAQKLSSYGGSATQPIYIPADGKNAGKPVAISYTIEKSVPSNAVFTDTWHKVSTSQDGYITKLPGNTTTFLRGDGTWGTPGGTYSLPLAASGTRGGIQVGYSSSGKNYAVQLDSEKAYVNVPWTDTKYSAGTGLSLNGTTFNHSNSITAGTVGTSSATSSTNRTITIPYITYDAQGHITASGTHTHTLDSFPEAYLSWGGKNFSASYGPIDAAMVPELGANRLAFLKASGITIEYSTNGGSTWTSYNLTDIQKTGIFAKGTDCYLGNANTKEKNNINNQLKITINTASNIYTVLNKIAIYMNTNGNTTQVKIEKATHANPTSFSTHLDWTNISGWSGWNILNISDLTTYGNSGNQYQIIVFTFKQTAINTKYPSTTIKRIMGFGGVGWTVPSNMATDGHLYNYDNEQNAIFPAQITATQFNGPSTGLTNKTLDSLTLNSTEGSFTFQGNGAPWDGTDWVGLQVGSNSDKFQIHARNEFTLEYRQNDSGGTNSNWKNWQSLLSSGNYTDYTVKKDGTGATGSWGISITGTSSNVTGTVAVGHGGTGATSFTSGALLIGNGTGVIGTRTIKNMTVKGNLGWTDSATDIYIPTINTLAYWDGRYSNSSSNLTYCVKGAFGDAAIKGVVTTLNTSANLPTAGAVSTALGNYVTLTTEQTISGHKTFSNLVTFKGSSGSEYCNINYDQTLSALVFSFG